MLYLFLIPLALAASIDLLGDKNPVYYFGIFCLGYFVMSDPAYTTALERDAPVSLAAGLLFSVITLVWSPHFSQWTFAWVGYGLMEQAIRLLLLLGILGIGHRFFNRNGKILGFLNEAAFPFYILHLPIVTLLGYFLIRIHTGIAIKYILIVALSYLMTFGTYLLLARSPTLRYLLGIKMKVGRKISTERI